MGKKKFSNLLVVLVIILNVLFTVSCLYVFLQTKSEPVVLITAWFGFTTGELWLLATIKKSKLKTGVITDDKLEERADKQ